MSKRFVSGLAWSFLGESAGDSTSAIIRAVEKESEYEIRTSQRGGEDRAMPNGLEADLYPGHQCEYDSRFGEGFLDDYHNFHAGIRCCY